MEDEKQLATQSQLNYWETAAHGSQIKERDISNNHNEINSLIDIGSNNNDLPSQGVNDHRSHDFTDSGYGLGGVHCDEEDRGLDEFTNLKRSNKFVPTLAFLDSDENVHEQLYNPEEHRTDKLQHKGPKADIEKVTKRHKDSFQNPNTEHCNRYSAHSSDSDLIQDHAMASERDSLVLSNGIEETQYDRHVCDNSSLPRLDLMWHCHRRILQVPPDTMAKKQLIAVSVLCFIFMVGEAVGKYKNIYTMLLFIITIFVLSFLGSFKVKNFLTIYISCILLYSYFKFM